MHFFQLLASATLLAPSVLAAPTPNSFSTSDSLEARSPISNQQVELNAPATLFARAKDQSTNSNGLGKDVSTGKAVGYARPSKPKPKKNPTPEEIGAQAQKDAEAKEAKKKEMQKKKQGFWIGVAKGG